MNETTKTLLDAWNAWDNKPGNDDTAVKFVDAEKEFCEENGLEWLQTTRLRVKLYRDGHTKEQVLEMVLVSLD